MPQKPTVRMEDVATWPRPVRQAIDAIATTMSALLLLVRTRAAESLSPLVRAFADRDAIFLDRELLRREADLLRGRVESLVPQHRPHYRPEARLAILQLMRLRHWTVEHTADRFAVHANTVRHWLKEFNLSPNAPLFTGAAPFNKLSQAAEWLVHEIRALCPEPEFGTRQIAARIVRAGVSLSRSSAQRILRKPKPPKPPAPAKDAPAGQKSEPAVPWDRSFIPSSRAAAGCGYCDPRATGGHERCGSRLGAKAVVGARARKPGGGDWRRAVRAGCLCGSTAAGSASHSRRIIVGI